MKRRALLFLLGAVSGTLGGMMGVGGGTVLVPLLVHVLHEDQHQAQGTSFAFIIVSALVAAGSYYTFERIDLPVSLYLILGAVPGVILGARLAAATPGPRLRVAFGVLLALTAIRLIAAPPHAMPEPDPGPRSFIPSWGSPWAAWRVFSGLEAARFWSRSSFWERASTSTSPRESRFS